MRRALVLLLFLGCHGAPVKAPSYDGPYVLRVWIDHFEGSYRYAVMADGSAVYQYAQKHGVKDAPSQASSATEAEVRGVAKILKANDFCALKSSDRPGIPDEASPRIDVNLPQEGLTCTISMWDGELRDNPKASASLAAVEDLGRSIKARAASR